MLHDPAGTDCNVANRALPAGAVWQNPTRLRMKARIAERRGVAGSAIKVPSAIPLFALVCLLFAAFTTTWGGLRFLPAGQIGDVFLAFAMALVMGLVLFSDLRFTTPVWMWVPPI